MESEVEVTREGAVLLVTINRPHARNAINRAVAEGIARAMDQLDGDPSLVIGILTGAGGTFSAGMDLKAFLGGERPHVPGRGFAGLVEAPPKKPLLAAVEGYALAGGFEIVLACDLVVAAEDAKLGLPETKRGLVAGAGGLLRLPSRLPPNVALEWILTGDFYPATEAHRHGLVNVLTPKGGALDGARELARKIAANGPLAVAASKAIVAGARSWPPGEQFARQRAIVDEVLGSADAKEGARAFAEKRPPSWSGT
ncbi:MAG: enoyl-CoA hydratase [Labilithrix sp.]|nr:enoyl-CoA hydratase [Labilithrix sp.]